MKITAFPAADGDCLLIESNSSRRILVDGGRTGPFGRHVLPVLAALRGDGTAPAEKLDVICVSHIDADHLEGILKMLDVEMQWRIFDAHTAAGDDDFKKPSTERACDFDEIWHNGFHQQLGLDSDLDDLPQGVDELGDIQDLINTMADLVTATTVDSSDYLTSYANLATSVPQALELVARIGAEQLDKTLNERFDGKLITSGVDPVELDDLKITFIGPTQETLEGLREDWLSKFRDSDVQRTIRNLRKRMADDIADLAAGTVTASEMRAARATLAADLPDEIAVIATAEAGELGVRSGITAPNLASLMFVVEEGDKRALFTGDGAGQDILAGLEATGFLDDGEDTIHLDLLKLQHHGAEFNIDEDFCRRVTATHYVISGDSNHHNPEMRVLDAIVNSRTDGHPDFAETDEAGDPFAIDMAMGLEIVSDSRRSGLEAIFVKLEQLQSGLPQDHMTVNRFEPPDVPVVVEL